MKRSFLLPLFLFLMILPILSGCLLVERSDGYRRQGDSHERDHGNHRGEEYNRH